MIRKLLIVLGVLGSVIGFSQSKGKNYDNIQNSNNIYEMDAFLRDAHPDDPRRYVVKPRLIKAIKEYLRKANPENQRIPKLQHMMAVLRNHPSTKVTYEQMNEEIRLKIIKRLQQEIASGRISYADVADSKYLEGLKTSSSGMQNQVRTSLPAVSPAMPNLTGNEEETKEYDRLMHISQAALKEKTTKVLNALFDNDPQSKECIVLVQNKSDCNIIMRIEGVGNVSYTIPVPSLKENSVVVKKGNYVFSSLVCGVQYASEKEIQKAVMIALSNPTPN